jgi:hypothetical protein
MPDCRGRLKTDGDGRYGYRAIVPVAYPIPGDVRPTVSSFPTFFSRFLDTPKCLVLPAVRGEYDRVPWASSFSNWDDTTSVRITCT